MSSRKVLVPATPDKSISTQTVPSATLKPYHCLRSSQELSNINRIVKLLKKDLTAERDSKLGSVYVIEERGSQYVKVGYTDSRKLVRAQHHINNCNVNIRRMYLTPGFRGAFRSEQIVHKLMAEHNFRLYGCPCNNIKKKSQVHTEWFRQTYENAVTTVLLVCNWMHRQSPYKEVEFESEATRTSENWWKASLKETWGESLDRWHETQTTKTPLGWPDFFWRHEEHWRGFALSPTSSSSKSRDATPRKAFSSGTSANHETRPMGTLMIHHGEDQVGEVSTYTEMQKKTIVHHERVTDRSLETFVAEETTRAVKAKTAIRNTFSANDLRERYNASPCPSMDRPGVESLEFPGQEQVVPATPETELSGGEALDNSPYDDVNSSDDEYDSDAIAQPDSSSDSEYIPEAEEYSDGSDNDTDVGDMLAFDNTNKSTRSSAPANKDINSEEPANMTLQGEENRQTQKTDSRGTKSRSSRAITPKDDSEQFDSAQRPLVRRLTAELKKGVGKLSGKGRRLRKK